MKFNKVVIGIVAAVILIAVAATVTWWQLDQDPAPKTGSCDGATYSLEAEREGETLEVSFELQSTAPAETWQVSIEQDGDVLLEGERMTDEDAEIDVDAFATRNQDGTFTVTATQGEQTCSAEITTG